MITATQIVVLLCTGLCTVIGLLSTARSMRHERETSRDARRLSNALVTHELLTDRMSAIERRQNKLAGTVYRDRRTDQGDARGEGDMSGEHEIKGFENLDPRFEAMVALQNASRAP